MTVIADTAIAPAELTPLPATAGRGIVAIAIAFVGLSFGSTLAKSTGAPGAVIAFWRFAIGASLWHVAIALGGRRTGTRRTVDRAAWRWATLPGIAFGINLSCFFSGATRTPIAHAEFISALAPVILVPLVAIRTRRRIERPTIVCGVIALTGVALILSRRAGAGTSYSGDLLVGGSVIAWIVYLLAARSARAQLSTAHFMAVMSTAACATTLPIVLSTAGPHLLVALSAKAWALIALLAVVAGMAAHGLIAWAQQRVSVGTISMIQLSQPALGAMWAALLLGETVSVPQVAGMALVLGAVAVIARRAAGGR